MKEFDFLFDGLNGASAGPEITRKRIYAFRIVTNLGVTAVLVIPARASQPVIR